MFLILFCNVNMTWTNLKLLQLMTIQMTEQRKLLMNIMKNILLLRLFIVEVKGKEVIYVDEVLMDALREIISLVQHPETVGDICTRDLVTATLETPVREVLASMLDTSFSHIPVLDDQGKLLGIFSENTIFTRVAKEGMSALTEQDCVGDFQAYLDIRDHVRDSFRFIAEDVETEKAVDYFKGRDKQGRRLAMLVVTKHGDPKEKVTGVLTPYDVLE